MFSQLHPSRSMAGFESHHLLQIGLGLSISALEKKR